MEFPGADRFLFMTSLYHHFALLHKVASNLDKTKRILEAGGAYSRLKVSNRVAAPANSLKREVVLSTVPLKRFAPNFPVISFRVRE